MKLEKWALIAEIASGVAVVITLIFLIVGIQANTEITRAAMYANSIIDLNETERAIMADTDLNEAYGAFLREETSDLQLEDRRRLFRVVTAISRTYDMAYAMERYGLFGANEWMRFEERICDMYRRAVSADMGENFAFVGSPEYQSFLESSC